MIATDSAVRLCGGIVAYNERERIGGAIASLLGQELPPGAEWSELIVVVSGSTDGTDQIVQQLAAADPRIRPVLQPLREGKSAAIAELFRRATGDYLVFLNGDARASPGAVRALLRAAPPPDGRFAVMGRPIPPSAVPGTFADSVSLLWSIHHALHAALLSEGSGNHLSDELLLFPVRELPPLAPGIVNDGSFVGGWLASHRGELRYAEDAVVTISTPRTFREHLRQRRRIVFGHRQVRAQLSVAPVTIVRYARRFPGRALRLLAAQTRRPGGVAALSTLLLAEGLAGVLAVVDARSSGTDHVRWKTIIGADATTSERVHPTLPAEIA